MFLDKLKEKYKINLNKQQELAVKHLKGPALILAGPGSGKTTVITTRTAYLILEERVCPDSILTLTYNKAAQLEMEHRFNKIFGSDIGPKVRFSTFHSYCNLVVMDYEKRQGKRLKRIEGDEQRKIVKSVYQQINLNNINDEELENLISEISFIKNRMIKELEGNNFSTKNFSLVYKAYEDWKKTNLYMDFDDMLIYALNILTKCPDILQHYRDKYSYFQVDEGQDLSKIQFEVLKLLVKSGESNVFIVADDDQSIYGFRGAEPQYILDAEKQFPGCKLFWLENNYRSSRNIVEITSDFIKKNRERFDKSHKTENELKCDPFIPKIKDESEQLKYVMNKVKACWNEEKGLHIAILYRNNLSSITIVDALSRNEIPFRIKQNKVFFFKHWIVQDILAFLRFSLNQCDYDSFMRIYYKMNRFISKSMLENAARVEQSESIIDAIIYSNDLKPFQKSAISELKIEFKRLAKKHPVLALEFIEEKLNYFDNVKEYCDSTGLCFDNLYSLYGILKTIAEGCPTIPLFLERIEELVILFEGAKPSEAYPYVTLTTMHSSKGLEYDCVMMVDLNNDEIPGEKAVEASKKGNNSLLEEERRLFYVGMTRAKKYLHLISPQARNSIPESRSIFIDEVIRCINKGMLDEVGEGVIVYHMKYGEGVIAKVFEQKNDRTVLEIDFNGMRKTLDLTTCMENGLISF